MFAPAKRICITATSFFAESPGCFEPFQTFYTRKFKAVTSFKLNDELFIAFPNYFDGYGGLNTKMPVYVLQKNNFTLNQTLDTVDVSDVEHFTIHSNHFLALANEKDSGGSKLDSVVYRWEAGTFREFQRILTNGAKDAHYFTINTRKFISFTNNMDGSSKVSIYEWKNGKLSNNIQNIQITWPYKCNTFAIQNITYIACGSWISAEVVTVLKWSGKRFEPFQELPSSKVVYGRPHIIDANGTVYLAIANNNRGYHESYLICDTDSFIYRWNGTKFVHHQSILTRCAIGWGSFASKGEVFFVVANSWTPYSDWKKVKSAVYKMAGNKFKLHQQLLTLGIKCVHAFTDKDKKQYLAVVSRHGSKGIENPVYIWN